MEDLRKDAPNRPGRYGIEKSFGRLLIWADNEKGGRFKDLVVESLVDFTASLRGFASKQVEARRRQSAMGAERPVPFTIAAKRLGISQTRMRRIAVDADLFIVEPTGKGAPATLPERAVQLVAEQLGGLAAAQTEQLTLGEAAAMLGVNKDCFRALLRDRLVQPINGSCFRKTTTVRRAEIHAILQALMVGVETLARQRPTGAITLSDGAKRFGMQLHRLVSAALGGELVPAFIDVTQRGIARYLYDRNALKAFARSMPRSGDPMAMSLGQAARELGVPHDAVCHFAKVGLLQVKRASRRRAQVTKQALAEFQAKFVGVTELAASLDLYPRAIARCLMRRGIRPVSGMKIDGGPHPLFCREDVHGIERGSLISGKSKLAEKPPTAVVRLQGRAVINKIVHSVENRFGPIAHKDHRMIKMVSGEVFHVKVARNSTMLGTYHYIFSNKLLNIINGRVNISLIFGFLDRSDAIFVAWDDLVSFLPDITGKVGARVRIDIANDGKMFIQPPCPWTAIAIN